MNYGFIYCLLTLDKYQHNKLIVIIVNENMDVITLQGQKGRWHKAPGGGDHLPVEKTDEGTNQQDARLSHERPAPLEHPKQLRGDDAEEEGADP